MKESIITTYENDCGTDSIQQKDACFYVHAEHAGPHTTNYHAIGPEITIDQHFNCLK